MLPIDMDDRGNLIYGGGVEPIAIRTSERSNFKKCRVLWDFTSPQRHNREAVRMNRNLSFGIAVHVGAEHFYDPQAWASGVMHEVKVNAAVTAFRETMQEQRKAEDAATGGLDPERQAEYRELTELGEGMLLNYGEWAEEEDAKLGLKPIATELKFQVPLFDENGDPVVVNGRPVVYQVRLDLIAEHEADDTLWVWDHKTANRLDDVGFLDLDTQLSSYAWATQRFLDRRIDGIMYNEMVKSVPMPPKVNKNGSLSQDKRQNTTYKLYMQSISELGLAPEPYEGMLSYLRDNERDYFRRTPVRRSQRELIIQGQYVVDEVRDMLGSPSIYPNPTKINCGGCDFRGPCGIRNEGGDFEFLLMDPMMYRTRPSEDDAHASG